MEKRRKTIEIAAALAPMAWAGLIFATSNSPRGAELPMLVPHFDKLVHAVVYGILSGCIALALVIHTGWSPNRIAWTALILASLYGVTDEFHQYFVPGRSTELLDWVADTTGASWVLLAARTQASWFVSVSQRYSKDQPT